MSNKKQLIETNGREESFEPTNLEQIMGFNELNRYNTLDASVYEMNLSEMNGVDLQDEARRVGAMILEDPVRLRNSLKKEFEGYIASLHRPRIKSKPIVITKEVADILKEGR